ncbi:dephospho-CoA kinase [Stratiformator vulcanicus]|uniref:Dephospho-CoA kinase n=1 Tax=Stratiformator vulcanicus TaxID=2527980 RepID=A0A517R685_9PLAN|nr:dephospho-CoA kinase [Stratiformator vulcanicus]QDT39380.1 Dephospho-CoA kinase [Stratiformator vulcanicus]
MFPSGPLDSNFIIQTANTIGFVGGIGSGKSAVARAFGERHRLPVLDADKFGHDALHLESVKSSLRNVFGDSVFQTVDGTQQVDRSALGRVVFNEREEAKRYRKQLEAIVHPVIRERIGDQIAALSRQPHPPSMIVIDAAVMLETGWSRNCDRIVFVDATEQIRKQRVKTNRDWTEDEWRRREQNQWPLDRKRDAADIVISNNGELSHAVDELERKLELAACGPAEI